MFRQVYKTNMGSKHQKSQVHFGKLKDADLEMLGFHGFSDFHVNLLEDTSRVWYFEPSLWVF